ncbi:MAG: cache domain-containing protein [Lachnospira eligens]
MVQKERSLLLILILRLQVGENITQRHGKTLSKGGLENGVDRTKEVWYTDCKGLKARNSIYAYFSKPYYSKDFDKTIITVSQEIKHSDGTNYGTVGMHIDFSEITDFVQGIGLLNTGALLSLQMKMVIYLLIMIITSM